jgi:hypothetical protein
MFNKIVRVAMVATVALTLAGTTAAHANPADVVKTGSCSRATDWKLKLKPDNGKIELEYEVDSNHVGQTWQVRITKNGAQIFRGSRRTTAPSGSFTVRRVTSNPAGSDAFRARATNAATGETCTGSATF